MIRAGFSAADFAGRLRRWSAGLAPRHARLVEALPLGPGSRLIVVEFGGRRHLIGQSRAGLVRLADSDAT